ncbi:MAG: 3-deoxy-7-phosphoheptulonate synthase [Deltaproteobacteria bacterium]|nr:3-deoxy-7-phosphoheptulonate synthase [Deltaproteobacteria bacterium]MBW2383953.1 3-deoxy-7-phosphoheptulonate synthase [Deltaproteobacteria bacterium]MBW2698938.1 3-deoxy-7-phosphoheptulonate synthase [Deltaproteobacteria bacterium]
MFHKTDDLRIQDLRPLISPAILMEDLPITEAISTTVAEGRAEVSAILRGQSDRLLVVVGPCSIHDPDAAREYAGILAEKRRELADDLCIVMRVYFEKPRTTVGWKGLINDPDLDESFSINNGLRTARRFLLDVLELGLPAGSEFLDPITPQFYADLVAWGAIGARTSESQVHRELASGLSMPVGFKNATDGNVQVAIDGISSSAHPHHFLSVTKQGVAAIVATRGNDDCHVILRGGASGPNYSSVQVGEVIGTLEQCGLPPHLMVDCSHANSGKDHEVQPVVAKEVAGQVAAGSHRIFGVMLESFLQGGRQNHVSGQDVSALRYGQSITDACMSWEHTLPVLEELAAAVRSRRGSTGQI